MSDCWGCEGPSFRTKRAKVVGVNQFFYFVLKRLGFIGGMTIVSVVFAVLGHVDIGGFKVLCGGGMRST